MVSYRIRDNCRLCNSNKITKTFSLQPTPPANAFVKKEQLNTIQECFPLDVYQCESCFHVQLLLVVDPEFLFNEYVYVSGTSKIFINHFKKYAHDIIDEYNISADSLIIEIGSNDGTLLKFFKNSGMRVLGVDPAINIANNATENGIKTLPLFFNSKVANSINSKYGLAKVIPKLIGIARP